MSLLPTICFACQHLIEFEEDTVPKCSVFPKEIPFRIASGEFDHREPYEGDGGMRFEQAPGPYAAAMLKTWEKFRQVMEETP